MSTARWRLKSPPVTIRYIRPHHHGHTSQYHGYEWMTHILFVPCRSAVPFLRSSYFTFWPWNSNSKVKVMVVVKGQGHTIGPVSYQLTSFSFHINQTNTSWDTAISKFDLVPTKVKVMSEVKGHIVPSIQPMHFLFVSHQSDKPFLRYGQNNVWPWRNTSEIFKESLPK